MKAPRYEKDTPHISEIRADVEYNSDSTLTISPFTEGSEERKPDISIEPELVSDFQTTIRNFLAAKAQIVIGPPDRCHITLDDDSICHINVDTQNAGTPDGYLSGRYFSNTAEENDLRTSTIRSRTATRAVPLSAFRGGILPSSYPICKFCKKKAQKLHLIANSEADRRPGTPIQECPVCDKAIKSGYKNFNTFCVHHQDFCRDVTDACKEQDTSTDDDTRKQFIGERLSIEELIEFFDREIGLSQIPQDDRFIGELELRPPAKIANSDITLNWANHAANCDGFRSYRYADALTTDSDNNHMPLSGFSFSHPKLENSRRIMLPEIETILSKADRLSESVNGDTYPVNRDLNVTSAPDTIINQIGSPRPSEPIKNRNTDTEKTISTEQINRSLTALEMVPASTDPERYEKENVDQRLDSFHEEYNSLSDVDVAEDGGWRGFKIGDMLSRHYHQRLGEYTETDSVEQCLDRLNIESTDTALIYGGYTGEFAQKMADIGHPCIFTDPLEDWTTHAETEYDFEQTITEPISGIPAKAFMQANVVATFEGYHGLRTGLGQGLYDILRIMASATHGLIFGVSFETINQMKHVTDLSQFRSAYNSLTDVYDLEINRRETDTLRLWQLKRSTDTVQSLAPILTDLFTVQAIIEVGFRTAADLEAINIDRVDGSLIDTSEERPEWFDSQNMEIFSNIGFEFELNNIIEELIQSHPMVSDKKGMIDSIARLQSFGKDRPANIKAQGFTISIPPEIQNRMR